MFVESDMGLQSRANQTFVFDFDGVICDSTDECLITSWNTWQQFKGERQFRYSVSEFDEVFISRFSSVRYRVRGAGEYYALLD